MTNYIDKLTIYSVHWRINPRLSVRAFDTGLIGPPDSSSNHGLIGPAYWVAELVTRTVQGVHLPSGR